MSFDYRAIISERRTRGLETRKTPGRMAARAWKTSSAASRGSRNCSVGEAARAVTSTPPPYDANSIMNPLTHLKTNSARRRHQGTVISSLSSCTSSSGIVNVVMSDTTALRSTWRSPSSTGWREFKSAERNESSDTKWNTT